MANDKAEAARFGFVAVAGLPNAGKSTLVNALVGEKVAIVTPKPQTTRSQIRGVLTTAAGQIVFIDTPGIHRSDSSFNRHMMSAVRDALESPDVRLYVADATRAIGPAGTQGLDTLRRAHRQQPRPAILVLNKVDLISDKRLLLPLIETYQAQYPFDEIVPLSALKGGGTENLIAAIFRHLPAGEPMFPPDHFTDQPERYLAAEMIREQILLATREEVPHSVAVRVEKWEETEKYSADGVIPLIRISAVVVVERAGQKGIVIGAQGQMLKQIGTRARHEIEAFTGRQVFLELFVQVQENWRENPAFVRELDPGPAGGLS
jgi:GTP-binding protein Era